MNYQILLGGEPIGTVSDVVADFGMGVVHGRLTPEPAYARIRNLVQRCYAATSPMADDEERQRAWDEMSRLDLTVCTETGLPVAVEMIFIEDDASRDTANPEIGADVAVADSAFWENPLLWPHGEPAVDETPAWHELCLFCGVRTNDLPRSDIVEMWITHNY